MLFFKDYWQSLKENKYLCVMKKEEIIVLFQEYEQAACEVNQVECWSARDLQKLLGYSLWQNFTKVIAKAKEACENVGQSIEDHFIDVNKMIIAGKGAQREARDNWTEEHITVYSMSIVGILLDNFQQLRTMRKGQLYTGLGSPRLKYRICCLFNK